MIKREDLPTVQSLHTDTCPQMEAVTKWEHKLTLDLIYDSIGSCGECKYSIKVEMMDNSEAYECANIRELSWGEVGYKDVAKDWFCADFERKTNED